MPFQKSDFPNVVALIPAYNESATIAGVILKTKAHLPVLVVDDGSDDGTAISARRSGANVVEHEANQGKGAALRTGLRWAVAEGYEAVVTLDADGQHDPLEIPHFLAAFRHQGADLVIGRRRFREMPPLRRVSNWVGRHTFSWIMGQSIPDNQSGYRLISRPLIETLLLSHEQGFEFEVEMITICVEQNFRLAWVPIRTIYGDETSHINPLRHTLNFLRLLWRTHRRLHKSAS